MSSEKCTLVLKEDALIAGKKLKAGTPLLEGLPVNGLTATAIDKAMQQSLLKVKKPVEQAPASKSKEPASKGPEKQEK